MLILTRRHGESLNIGDTVKVTVLGVRGSEVRIGIDAPRVISVHRAEVYERIRSAKDPDLRVVTSGLAESHDVVEGDGRLGSGPQRLDR